MSSWQTVCGDDPPDEWLMRLVASGETGAFGPLVDRYEGPLLAYFRRSTGDLTVAEELVSDTFLNLFRSRGGYDPARALKPYIYGIARRCLIDWLNRAHSAQAVTSLEIAGPDQTPATADPGPAAAADATDRREVVRRTVMALPEPFREAVTLCYFDGLRPSQAAETLQVPPATVRSRLARGLALLRLKLGSL